MQIYDRAFKLPVILDMSELSEEQRSKILKGLDKFSPKKLTYPSEYAIEVAKDLANRGWPSFAQKLPLSLSAQEATHLFACTLKIFNDKAYVKRTPDASRINRNVSSTADFERIVDEFISQQDEISLSQIFSTANRASDVFWTDKTIPANANLAENIVPITKLGETPKSLEGKLRWLHTQVEKNLEEYTEKAKVTFRDQGSKFFQYR